MRPGRVASPPRAAAAAGGAGGPAGSRALLLHGRGGSGPRFGEALAASPLGRELGLREAGAWVAPSGPVPLGAGPAGGSFAWWEFPPGVERSFLADEWVRSEEAIEIAAEAGRGCDVAIGFSQGAMLLAVLIALGKLPDLRCAVIAGAGWPRPYAEELEKFAARGRRPIGGGLHDVPKILHVSSETDTMNPLAQAQQVHRLLGGDFLEHGGGHVVPVEAEELAKWMKLTRAPA